MEKSNAVVQSHRFISPQKILFLSILISFIIALVFDTHLQSTQDEQNKIYFNKIIEDVRFAFEHNLHPLQGLVATLHYSNLNMDAKKFRISAESRDLFRNFKGALGFGFIRKVKSRDLHSYIANQKKERPSFDLKRLDNSNSDKELFIIEVVEPIEINEKAIGLVISDEKNRKDAAVESMQTGQPKITRSIQLVQSSKKEKGFLYFLPIYKTPHVPENKKDIEKNLLGWAYTPLLAKEIVNFVLSQSNKTLPFRIFEVHQNSELELLYEDASTNWKDHSANTLYLKNVNIAGQTWQIQAAPNLSSLRDSHIKSGLLLVCLIFLSYLIFVYQMKEEIKTEHQLEIIRKSQLAVDAATRELEDKQKLLSDIESTVDRIAKIIKGLKVFARDAEQDHFKLQILNLL